MSAPEPTLATLPVAIPVPSVGADSPAVIRASAGPEFATVLELRRRVFRDEQHIASAAVTDPDDERSLHALAFLPVPSGDPRPVATGRLTLGYGDGGEALIAWVATLPEARGRGAGLAVMQFLLDAADKAMAPIIVLSAQTHAEGFYRRLGFIPAGRPFVVRNIEHCWMARPRRRETPPGRSSASLSW
jgi:predicted GNAT family N-acyltransferase